ncbi:hypothetical protein C4D60_Mb06t36780 [Musa balbisiana]|uniref:Uncharacterized protein n=1 Tax=Musa balbisiana TaxID=52838 RepID=A0A4S8IU43_MUSBA|nr:hypothetical protein C4D60_Mb06t36780 [Musa balbisiana]
MWRLNTHNFTPQEELRVVQPEGAKLLQILHWVKIRHLCSSPFWHHHTGVPVKPLDYWPRIKRSKDDGPSHMLIRAN